ncbi:kelch-like protein 24 [Branchiostoma lanceolatum]|uniref:kelch-like protein 24 n=1 Tax=Branchiostoma lanceolatum TaxID=7740 RepID=UPI0034537D2E
MMAETQRSQAPVNFCHNPHADALLQGLQELRSDNLLTDVVLCVSGKEIPCHRSVLAACSEYFRAMFCSGHHESKEHKVTIHEVSPGALQLLVDYAYTSKVTITEDNAVKLLEGANFFRFPPVRDACVTFILNNLSAKDCLQILQVGNMLSCPDLEKKARLCALNEFAAVSKTPEFLSMTKDQLITLISSDDLNATEEVVYEAVMAWINHDTRKRKKEMRELMELVRFPFMDKLYFMENVERNGVVRKSCQDILTEAHRCQHFPGEVRSPRSCPRRASGLRETVVVIGGEEPYRDGHFSHFITMTSDAEPTISSWNDLTKPTESETFYYYQYPDDIPYVAVLGTSDIVMCIGEDVWLYQPQLDFWFKIAQMKLPRRYHGLAVLYGKVYAIGGTEIERSQGFTDSVEVYDRRLNVWTEGVPLPEPRWDHAVAVLDSSIYVMGGSDDSYAKPTTMYCFNPGDLQWKAMGDMPEAARNANVTTTVLNGNIYMTGIHSSIYCYTPSKDGGLWSKVASGVPSGCGMTAFGGKVYCYGGFDETEGESAAVMCLDPDSQSLSLVGTMAKPVSYATCITILKYCIADVQHQ